MKTLKLILVSIFFLNVSFSFAQDKDNQNQLALLYYSKAEYDKASEIYFDLYSESHSEIHFTYLLDCYKQLKQYENAENLIKQQLKYYPKSYFYQISLAYIYNLEGKLKEAEDIHEKVNKKSVKQEFTCLDACKAYIELDMYARAKTLLLIGKEKFSHSVEFSKELTKIYFKQSEYASLIKEYITILLRDENELEFVENNLQFELLESPNEELKSLLFDEIFQLLEKDPNSTVLQELLQWLYMQEGNLKEAFKYARALDIKLKENGKRMYELGRIAKSDKDYEIATNCFSYVLSKGKDDTYYMVSLKALAKTAQEKVFNSQNITNEDLLFIERQYVQAFNELGKNSFTSDIGIALAHLQAFYLSKTDAAIELLNEFINQPRLEVLEKAKCEIELADIYVFSGDIWTANLMYARIAMQYKNNEIGHEAQLKQAKIAYYNGQFEYAQALLDVIKASTSKLISNNAFELSQLISDNLALDTSSTALELFSKADLCLYQKKYSESIQYLDSLVNLFPGHTLEDEILYRKALLAKQQGNFADMVTFLTEITERFSYDILADNAHYMLAEYYNYVTNEKEKAKKHYEEIILNFPTSFYLADSRKKYRQITTQ